MKSSTTIEQLLDKNIKARQKATSQEALILQALNDDLVEIFELAITGTQREHYDHIVRNLLKSSSGSALDLDWDNRFRKLSRLDLDKGSLRIIAARQALEWQNQGNTQFRRFQEAFCHSKNLIVLQPFPQQKERHKDGQLLGCLVSADLIPDKLAKDLGLVEFADGDTRLEMLRKKSQPEVLAALKCIFEHAVNLRKGNQRILFISNERAKTNPFYPGAESVLDKNSGTILYTHEINRKPSNGLIFQPRRISVQHFKLYDARDKTLHVHLQYHQESKKLTSLIAQIDILDAQFQKGALTTTAAIDTRNKNAFELLKKTISYLEKCSNKYKKQAHKMLGKIKVTETEAGDTPLFVDSLDRKNTLPLWTILCRARYLLSERSDEIGRKYGANEEDFLLLTQTINSCQEKIEGFAPDLAKNVHFLSEKHALFNGTHTNPLPTQVQALIGKLGVQRASLVGVDLEPLKTFADKLNLKLKELENAMLVGNLEASKDAALKIHVILKFYAIKKAFATIKKRLISDAVNLTLLKRFTTSIREHAEKRQIFATREVEGYADPFKILLKHLQRLEKGLEKRERQRLNKTEKAAMLKRLALFLDESNIEDTVRALP